MWFHASLKDWGGILDQMSMFVYAAFLVFYSIRRLWKNDLFFLLAYSATVAVFTILGAVLVAAYLIVEAIICIRSGKFLQGKTKTCCN